ncbi:MAG: hypothetical protein EOO24_04875 [Comamonadaceae bacterium]|nr:MAG: hypothetical protein EOO24_04875 [Comamonadaceae bacterium]
MHYLLSYQTAPDYLERRAALRDAHLALAWASVARGELILGGATGEPPDGALLLFRAHSPAVAEAFAQADPYVLEGLVVQWRVTPWNTVAGDDAAHPVRPATDA